MGLHSASKLWKKDEIAALIALYETERCLYDPSDKHFNDCENQTEAYKRIHKIMLRIRSSCTVGEIKYKINYLQRQYAGEIVHRNISIQAGLCTEETYKSNMWCFGLLKFLDEFLPFLNTLPTDESVEEGSNEPVEKVSPSPKSMKYGPMEVAGSSDTVIENGDPKSCPKERISKKRKLCNSSSQTISQTVSKTVSKKLSPQTLFDEREDIFGQYVASEMKNLKDNPLLYLQTKQSILQILTSANFELLNPE